jgi:hypothetical protein
MSNVKICNLDLIAPIQKREIVLGGVTYPVEPLTVERFIEFNKMRQKITSGKSVDEGLRLSKEMIKAAIPTMTEAVLKQLTINHLQYIVLFINDEIPDEVLNGETEQETATEAQKGETSEGKQ